MGDDSGGSELFEESIDSSLLSHSDVTQLLADVNTHRDTMLNCLGNEKSPGVKAQLREAINKFSAILTKITTAYLCKLEVERVHGSCIQALNSACKKVEEASIVASDVISNNANTNARTYADAAAFSALPRSSQPRNYKNKIVLNRGKSFNIKCSSRVTIGPRDASKNKFLTSKVTHETVKKVISPSQLKISVNRVLYTGNSTIILEGDSLDTDAIKNQLARVCPELEVKSNASKNPRLIIHDVPVELSAADIIDRVICQNLPENLSENDRDAIKIIYMYPQRDNKKFRSCVIEVKPDHRKALLAKDRVYIDWRSCRVADHISLLQCFQCLKFGHTANECKGSVACGFCAGSHTSNSCPNKTNLRCISCTSSNITASINHSAYDRSKCPIMRKQLERAISFVNYGD